MAVRVGTTNGEGGAVVLRSFAPAFSSSLSRQSSSSRSLRRSLYYITAEEDDRLLPAAKELFWENLSRDEKSAAISLGWSADTWDDGDSDPMEGKFWQEMTEADRAAAAVLGHTRETWDHGMTASEAATFIQAVWRWRSPSGRACRGACRQLVAGAALGQKARVVTDYKNPSYESAIAVEAGMEVELLNTEDVQWWKVAAPPLDGGTGPHRTGYVPAAFLAREDASARGGGGIVAVAAAPPPIPAARQPSTFPASASSPHVEPEPASQADAAQLEPTLSLSGEDAMAIQVPQNICRPVLSKP